MYVMYLLVMCWPQYPPNFFGKKNGNDQNLVSCTKKSLSLVSTRNDNISRGVRQKWNFQRGWGGPFCEPILENPEGRGSWEKIPSMGGYGYFLELHIMYLFIYLFLENSSRKICMLIG